jgi:probable F420-dependent oxidoreductase
VTVRIGIGLFTGQVPPGSGRTFVQEYRETLDLVRLAETLGFDSAWVSEHHGAGDGYLPSLLPMLGGFAAATDRIELGTGVLLAPFHDPLRLAEDAATVDLISDGRLLLGLGLGWREEEFRMFDVPMPERVRRTVETIEILRKAWTGERFDHDGKVFRYEQVQVTPKPARPGGIPIWLGGTAEKAMRRAGRLADGYIRTRAAGGLQGMREDAHAADDAAREAARGVSTFGFAQLQNVWPWDRGEPWEAVREGAAFHLGVYGGWAAGGDVPGTGYISHPPDEETLKMITPAGSPEEITRFLRPIVEAFADRPLFHLIVKLHYPGMSFETSAHAVELFGERVLPALKGA